MRSPQSATLGDSPEPQNTASERRLPPPPPPDNKLRPKIRNTFELEPNPFERSFSVSSPTVSSLRSAAVTRNASNASQRSPTRHSDSSGSSAHNGDPHPANTNTNTNGTDTPKPTLPPLASIASPSDPNYVWSLGSAGLNSSLRAGPLSPAMLAGPQPQSHNPAPHHSLLGFDPTSTFRTGLTPSTGLTPLVGGPVAFPPPSPNTAAFLAMVNNASASAASATITPNTLNALTGVLQASNPSSSLAQSQRFHNSDSFSVPSQRMQPTDASQQPSHYANPGSNSSSASNNVNGLFLLSQAHQELTKREEAQKNQSQSQAQQSHMQAQQQQQQHLQSAQSNDTGMVTRRGSKRKIPDPPPPAKSSKRTRSSAANEPSKLRRGSTGSVADQTGDEDEEEEEDESVSGQDSVNGNNGGNNASQQNKKPETEEEKRRNFLERNRQAALKCRQRKKAWLAQLQAKVEFLSSENERLTAALVSSREEISRLSALVGSAGIGLAGLASVNGLNVGMYHAQQQAQQQAQQGTRTASTVSPVDTYLPSSMNTQHQTAFMQQQPVAASGDGGRGYGY